MAFRIDPLSTVAAFGTLASAASTILGYAVHNWKSRPGHRGPLHDDASASASVVLRASGLEDTETGVEDSQVGMRGVGLLSSLQDRLAPEPHPGRPRTPASILLLGFCGVLFAVGVPTLIYYWKAIISNTDNLIFGIWLFLTMVFGMFVQVMVDNHESGRAILDIRLWDFLFPLFFSLVVYYSIWSVAATAPRGLFSFYAAFLNGYFWRHVVAQARPSLAGHRTGNDDQVAPNN